MSKRGCKDNANLSYAKMGIEEPPCVASPEDPKAPGAYVDDAVIWEELEHAIIGAGAERLRQIAAEVEAVGGNPDNITYKKIKFRDVVEHYEFYTVPSYDRDWWLSMKGVSVGATARQIKNDHEALYNHCSPTAASRLREDQKAAFDALHPDWVTAEELSAITGRALKSIYNLCGLGMTWNKFKEVGATRLFWLPDALEFIAEYDKSLGIGGRKVGYRKPDPKQKYKLKQETIT